MDGHAVMIVTCYWLYFLYDAVYNRNRNKKDGYRQQNVRQRQKLISIIDYDVYDFLLVRHCNYRSILYYLRVI